MLNLEQIQKHVDSKYGDTDRERGSPATFLYFIEEVGELATALAGSDRSNLEEEFADVLAWLCTMANINNVDLADAFAKKYLTNDGPTGVK